MHVSSSFKSPSFKSVIVFSSLDISLIDRFLCGGQVKQKVFEAQNGSGSIKESGSGGSGDPIPLTPPHHSPLP